MKITFGKNGYLNSVGLGLFCLFLAPFVALFMAIMTVVVFVVLAVVAPIVGLLGYLVAEE